VLALSSTSGGQLTIEASDAWCSHGHDGAVIDAVAVTQAVTLLGMPATTR